MQTIYFLNIINDIDTSGKSSESFVGVSGNGVDDFDSHMHLRSMNTLTVDHNRTIQVEYSLDKVTALPNEETQ